MSEFPSYPKCEACVLWAAAENRGLPARPADNALLGHETALLVVGEAPGFREDQARKSWVGRSGQLLHKALDLANLNDVADVYLDNACRCRPPQNRTPTESNLKSCRPRLIRDIQILSQDYDGHLVILCAGAAATQTVLQLNLSQALDTQGTTMWVPSPDDLCPTCAGGLAVGLWGATPKGTIRKCPECKGTGERGPLFEKHPVGYPVFATHHPARLLRDPSLINSMRDHLMLLHRHLTGASTPVVSASSPAETPEYALNPERPPDPASVDEGILSLDIETYGALAGQEQTVFNPRASEKVDLVPRGRQIATVALSWLSSGKEQSVAFVYEKHKYGLLQWLTWVQRNKLRLLGQNIPFDIQYLRYNDPVLRLFALEFANVELEDTMLWNFLHSELRPERGLKAVATLFALSNYKKFSLNAQSADDPALLAYNVLDTRVTLRARRLFLDAIARDYSPSSPKLSAWTRQFISSLLWQVIHLSEAGLPYSVPGIQRVNNHHLHCAILLSEHAKKFGLLTNGAGSKKSQEALVNEAVRLLNLGGDSRLLLTEKTREISTKDENLVLIREAIPANATPEIRRISTRVTLLRKYREHAKIEDTYTRPLLTNPRAGIVDYVSATVGLAYPSWYACPSKYDETNDRGGGTVQARITCRRPGAQTSPKEIKNCYVSRWPDGIVLWADLSQIELRVPALMSGDPVMLQEYADGIDRHMQQGLALYQLIAGRDPQELLALPKVLVDGKLRRHPTLDYWRQGGKHTNFLLIFEGQALKLTQLLRNKIALAAPVSSAQRVVDAFNARYTRLRAWQDDLVDRAGRLGYLEVPTGWSRTYIGGKQQAERDRATIVNQPVQTIAAQLLQSAAYEVLLDMRRHRLRAVMDLNVYDAFRIDCPASEALLVRGSIEKHLPHPPLLGMLEQVYGRTVKLEYDLQEKRFEGAP